MSYLYFHLIFTVPVSVILYFLNRIRGNSHNKKSFIITTGLIVLAVFYTTPWDSYLIKNEVWKYDLKNILFTINYIPIEEYFFFIIQTISVSLACRLFLVKNELAPGLIFKQNTISLSVVLFLIVLFILSLKYIFYPNDLRYLSLILAWALPILLIQWIWGGNLLIKNYNLYLKVIFPATIYLWLADLCAIYLGIWWFPKGQNSGFMILPYLPIEEALFFFVTTCMVGQGYFLASNFKAEQIPNWMRDAKSRIS